MNSFFIRNRIHRYLDGELSEQETLEMEKALEEHPDILEEIQDLDTQRLFLSENGFKKAPVDLLSNILDEIKEEPLPVTNTIGANNLRWFVLSAVALALFAVLLPQNPEKISNETSEVKSARSFPVPNIIELPPREAYKPIDATLGSEAPSSPTSKSRRSTKPRKAKPEQLHFVIGTAENPYTATWEETAPAHTITTVISEAQQTSYQIRLAKEDILFHLQSLAQRANGKIVSSEGVEFSPFNLNGENGFQTLTIVVPKENYTLIDENLRQFGATTSLETLPVLNGQVSFPVAVYYQFY
jgi:hypothetical protein